MSFSFVKYFIHRVMQKCLWDQNYYFHRTSIKYNYIRDIHSCLELLIPSKKHFDYNIHAQWSTNLRSCVSLVTVPACINLSSGQNSTELTLTSRDIPLSGLKEAVPLINVHLSYDKHNDGFSWSFQEGSAVLYYSKLFSSMHLTPREALMFVFKNTCGSVTASLCEKATQRVHILQRATFD